MKDMSVELLKLYYDAFNRGDAVGMLDLIADDIVHEPSQGAVRNGKVAFAQFLDHMNCCYKEKVVDPVFLTSADGTHGAAEFVLNGTYLQTDGDLPAANGQKYRLRVGTFFEIANGKFARVSNHYNLADWLVQIR